MNYPEHERAKALGHLYDAIAALFADKCDMAYQRRELSRLCTRYPKADVEWMLRVVAEDLEAARGYA